MEHSFSNFLIRATTITPTKYHSEHAAMPLPRQLGTRTTMYQPTNSTKTRKHPTNYSHPAH